MTFSILTSIMAYDDHFYIHLSSNVCKLVYYTLGIPLMNKIFSVLPVYAYIVRMVYFFCNAGEPSVYSYIGHQAFSSFRYLESGNLFLRYRDVHH